MIWGIAGAFLATPMTAVLRIVLEKIPATLPLANILAGRLDAVLLIARRNRRSIHDRTAGATCNFRG